MTSSTAKCIIYARFSDRPDRATSESNNTQIELCTRHAERHGYEIVGEPFTDEAKSGKDRKRIGLNAAIEALRPGYVLLAYSSSRLARDYLLSEHIFKRVAKRKAFVEFVDDGKRVSNEPMEVCMRQVRAAFDELDRKMIGKRTKDAMARIKANGYRTGKDVCYGKRLGATVEVTLANGSTKLRTTVEDDPYDQALIQRIHHLHFDKHFTFMEIHKKLQREGATWHGGRAISYWAVTRVCKRVV